MKEPMVSVVMPAFNAERYIAEAINSVKCQTLRDWELLVVNDCSTDSTSSIVADEASKDVRIRLIANEENLGAAATRNAGLSECRGKYVALLDSDDLWEATKLEKQVRCAEESGAGVVYCSYALIDESGRKALPDYVVPDRTDFASMLEESVIGCSTALIDGELTRRYQFPTNVYHEDYAYWLCLLKNGASAVGVRDVLASYRIHVGSRASNKIKCALKRYRVYRDYLGVPLFRSLRLMSKYCVNGIKKYRKS